jgi:hypothetical protein
VALVTSTSDDVVPPLAQVFLLGRGPDPLSFPSGGAACGGALSGTVGRLHCKGSRRFFVLNTTPIVRRNVSSAATALRLFTLGRVPPERWEPPHATQRGAYPQLRCVCSKRWQRLHLNGLLDRLKTEPTLARRRVL